jgi:hypothetical protein
MTMPSPLDQVLDAVRGSLEAQQKAARERVAGIRAAVDEYVAALERQALTEILGKVSGGKAVAEGLTAKQAARALRNAVDELPELLEKKPPPKPAPPEVAKPPPVPARGSKTRVSAGPGLTAKLALPAALKAKAKELRAEALARPARLHLPTLLAGSGARKIVLVGGLVKRDKLAALVVVLGFTPEWVETEGTAKNTIRALEGRILDGRIAGVVVLEGIMSHTHVEPLLRAARQTGTPFAYADRGGKASFERAFEELEEAAARRA